MIVTNIILYFLNSKKAWCFTPAEIRDICSDVKSPKYITVNSSLDGRYNKQGEQNRMKSSFEKYFDAQMTLGGCGLWIIGILVVLYFVYSWIRDIIDGDLQTIIITSSIAIVLFSFFIPLIFAI